MKSAAAFSMTTIEDEVMVFNHTIIHVVHYHMS